MGEFMSDKIQVDLGEVKQLFSLLEELHEFFHQPMHYENSEEVTNFLQNGTYEKLRMMYYDTVWNWLPPEVQQQMEDRQYSLADAPQP